MTTSGDQEAECVFSSDGLPPLSIPPPPISLKNNDKHGEEILLDTESSIDPIQAFEVFSGKVFPPSSRLGTSRISYETPHERLARLKVEISELELELNRSDFSSQEDNDDTQNTLTDLSKRLIALSSRAGDVSAQKQHNLSSLVKAEVAKMSDVPNVTPPENKGLGLVYELYANPEIRDEKSDGSCLNPSLEGRLSRIESLVATSGLCSTRSLPVLERLQDAEAKIKNLDEKTLQAASAKAKVIRADLEAAAKARTKLSSHSNGDDAKVIAKLYQQLLDLDGFVESSSSSNVLSCIVERLSTCANLHSQSMNFNHKLSNLEHSTSEKEQLLSGIESALIKVETGMAVNLDIIQHNMTVLDERVKDLCK